ncbi:type II toxin-antitoxin system VapC family toxin [Peteryoungia desertarenae]|uniref:Type II toxin-antitoxin system VapC family toxin n=1 Tax=Peteryoungia desertarenae TaxID=1813451 RepID=A0ABX6QKP4_9HYPH|nr:type II toxin-antitoxin system VapC family toxin [Peteryoungia desertarenae]QLF69054.1 type II toxin-antitoxin system VapC family toxin [Peteryoungia desertarenae]
MTGPTTIYLDTNVLILFKEVQIPEQEHLTALLATCRLYGHIPFTSALTYSELLVKPLADGNRDLIATYESWMGGGLWLNTVQPTSEVFLIASLIRARSAKTKLPDAIHLASAIFAGCSVFLSADTGLTDIDELVHPVRGRLPITPLKVLRPDVETLTSLAESLSA